MNASASYSGSSTATETRVFRFSPERTPRSSTSSRWTTPQSFAGDFRIASIRAASARFSASSLRIDSISRRASL